MTQNKAHVGPLGLAQMAVLPDVSGTFGSAASASALGLSNLQGITDALGTFGSAASASALGLSNMQGITDALGTFGSATSANALGLSNMQGITAVSKMFESAVSANALGLSNMQSITDALGMFGSATSASALGFSNMQGITAVSKMFESAVSANALGLSNMKAVSDALGMLDATMPRDMGSSILQNDGVPTAIAAVLQTNAAASETLSAVAEQRVVALSRGAKPGSFDSQFAAIIRHFDLDDFPSQLRDLLSVEEGDVRVTEVTAASIGLSAVPSNPADRLMLEILIGFIFTIVYGVMQLGMTGDPITPSFVIEAAAAGGVGFKSVTWAPQVLEKLKKL